SIDQVIGAVAERWKDKSGAIIFSGMGEDGTKTVLDMHEQGGIILAQDQKSCVNSCMPDAIRRTGCVTYNGSPQQLAYQFVDLIRKQMPVAS
ncbi:MAG TPA: chemotaxis protein CheB, partial [Pseudomonadales bacterium]